MRLSALKKSKKKKVVSTNWFHCRFIQCKSISLEKTYKYELLAKHDLGITIDLISPDAYATKPNAEEGLDYADEKLLEEGTSAAGPKDQQG